MKDNTKIYIGGEYSKELTSQVNEVRAELLRDIADLQNQIELVESINWDNPVNETKWHEICSTPLRYNKALGRIVKNIFPDAENITVGSNYVSFYLDEFECGLSTSCAKHVYVNMDWYRKPVKTKEDEQRRAEMAANLATNILPRLEQFSDNVHQVFGKKRVLDLSPFAIEKFKEEWASKEMEESGREN